MTNTTTTTTTTTTTITLTESQRKALGKLLRILWETLSPFGPIIISATYWFVVGLGGATRKQGFGGQELLDLESIATMLHPPSDASRDPAVPDAAREKG